MRGWLDCKAGLRAVAILVPACLAACAAPSAPEVVAASDDPAVLCRSVDQLLLSGQRNSFGLQFSEAENAFAELLSLYSLQDVNAICPNRPSSAFVLMNQALAHSSQERFATADGLFAQAERMLSTASEVPPTRLKRERDLLAAYRAQDLLNRSAVLGPREFADAAAASFPANEGADSFSNRSDFEAMLFGGSDEAVRALVDEASNNHARSHILLLEGDTTAAMEAINYALDLVALAPQSAAVYRPRFVAQRALINYESRRYRAARSDASEAAESFAALLPGSPLEARARISHGRSLAALGQIEESLAEYERGFKIYEENPVIVEYRTLWPFFRLALNRAEEVPERRTEIAERMFRAAQVVRRSITAQTVSGAAALLGEADDAKGRAVRDWRAAEERFSTLKALQIIQLQDPLNQAEQTEELARRVSAARQEVDRLRATRDRLAPEYQSAISSPVSLAEVQSALKPGEALLQIVAGEPRSILFLIDRDGITAKAVQATEGQFAVLIAGLRRAVQVDRDGVARVFRADFAHVLHNLLFTDILTELAAYDKLVVATSGALQSFPLELLVTAPPGSSRSADWAQRGDYTGVKWLGAEKAISYVPSPRNLVDIRLRAGVSSAPRSVAAFGDFRSGVDAQKVLRIADLPDSCASLARAVGTIGDLPGTAAEVAGIKEIFGTDADARTGADFTEEHLKAASEAGELANYKVLHFATHGILWPTPDCFTDPALTVSATDDPDSDGLLTATEIRAFDLDAQLIVLSACNTASTYLASLGSDAGSRTRALAPGGERSRVGNAAASRIIRESGAGGESLSGLARAFFSAGARTVLATHWPVADAETTELVTEFFRRLKTDGVSFNVALRSAQEDLRRRPATSHPVFWGPFVLIGDGGLTLEQRGDTPQVDVTRDAT
ncbi:MAG: CHAT domain-containing protein [Pseudomonadota bacterium]